MSLHPSEAPLVACSLPSVPNFYDQTLLPQVGLLYPDEVPAAVLSWPAGPFLLPTACVLCSSSGPNSRNFLPSSIAGLGTSKKTLGVSEVPSNVTPLYVPQGQQGSFQMLKSLYVPDSPCCQNILCPFISIRPLLVLVSSHLCPGHNGSAPLGFDNQAPHTQGPTAQSRVI